MIFLCHFCKQIFSRKWSLDRHIEAAHMEINFKCASCDKSYKRKLDLSRHTAETHSKYLVWHAMRAGYLPYMRSICLLDESGVLLEGPNPRYQGNRNCEKRPMREPISTSPLPAADNTVNEKTVSAMKPVTSCTKNQSDTPANETTTKISNGAKKKKKSTQKTELRENKRPPPRLMPPQKWPYQR